MLGVLDGSRRTALHTLIISAPPPPTQIVMAPVSLQRSTHYFTCNVQLAICQPCNRLTWVWQTRWQRLNGEECMLCRWIHYLNCARAVETVAAAWWAQVSSLSHLGVHRLTKEQIFSWPWSDRRRKGQRRWEKWSDSYGVMSPFSLMLRPLSGKLRRDLVTQLTIRLIPEITQPYNMLMI